MSLGHIHNLMLNEYSNQSDDLDYLVNDALTSAGITVFEDGDIDLSIGSWPIVELHSSAGTLPDRLLVESNVVDDKVTLTLTDPDQKYLKEPFTIVLPKELNDKYDGMMIMGQTLDVFQHLCNQARREFNKDFNPLILPELDKHL